MLLSTGSPIIGKKVIDLRKHSRDDHRGDIKKGDNRILKRKLDFNISQTDKKDIETEKDILFELI